jgi:hypothetical protein
MMFEWYHRIALPGSPSQKVLFNMIVSYGALDEFA